MQGTFINNILSSLVGKGFETAHSMGYSNSLSLLAQSAVKLRSTLTARIAAYDNLLLGFLQDQSLVADKWADTSIFTPDTYSDFVSTISQDTAENLLAAISEFIQMNVDSEHTDPTTNSLVLVSEEGYQFIFRICDELYDGKRVLLTNTAGSISDARNAVLYVDEHGHYRFSNVLFSQYWPFTQDPADPQPEYKHTVSNVWDVLNSLIQTNEINTVLKTGLSVTSSVKGASDILAAFQTALSSKYESVRSTANRLIDAFNTGGFAGLIACVASIIDKGCTLSNDDGTLQFTDNNALVPRQYIASAVASVLTSVGNIASMLLTIISKPIGLALGVVATVAQGIINSISFNYNQTNAALFDSIDACINVAPYGICQAEVAPSYLSEAMRQYIAEESSIAAIDIPGGTLFIGAGSFGDDGSISSYRIEFHPSLESHQEAMLNIVNYYHINNYIETETVGAAPNTSYHWRLTGLPVMDADKIIQLWCNSVDSNVYLLSNGSDGYLSTSDSKWALNRVAKNLAVFFFFYCACTHSTIDHFRPTVDYSDDVWFLSGSQVGTLRTPWTIMAWGAALGRTLTWSGGHSFIVDNVSGTGDEGWTGLSQAIASWPRTLNGSSGQFLYYATAGLHYVGLPFSVPQNFQYGIKLPKYDQTTFLLWIVVGAVVTAAVAITTAVVAVKVSKAINAKRAANNASVEKAWDTFKTNPTPEAWSTYRKTVKKNNIWTRFIGGTRYDYNNYWNGDVRDTASADDESTSKFASFLGNDAAEENASQEQYSDINTLIKLIRG